MFYIVQDPRPTFDVDGGEHLFLIVLTFPKLVTLPDGTRTHQGFNWEWASTHTHSTPFFTWADAHVLRDIVREHWSQSLFNASRVVDEERAIVISTMQS